MKENIKVDIKRWRKEIRRGVLKMCVLLLLSKKEMYGYEISKALESLGEEVLRIDEGTLYPLLRRLESSGYVVAEWRYSNGKARRYYRITALGSMFLDSVKSFWEKLTSVVDKMLRGEFYV